MPEINEIATLASFTGTQFPSTKAAKAVAAEVAAARNVNEDSYVVSQTLFPASECGEHNSFTSIKTFIGRQRVMHKVQTLPYEKGWQLLPLAALDRYDNTMLEAELVLRDQFIPELRGEYDRLVAGARRAHRGDFIEAHYPPIERFIERFVIFHRYRPVPTGETIASNVFNSRMAEIRAGLAEGNQRLLQAAVSETWRRLMEPVLDLASRLVDPEQRKLKHVVDSVRAIANQIPTLNLTRDPQLALASERILGVLQGISSDALHENASLRTEKAQQLLEMSKTFGAIGQRKFAA